MEAVYFGHILTFSSESIVCDILSIQMKSRVEAFTAEEIRDINRDDFQTLLKFIGGKYLIPRLFFVWEFVLVVTKISECSFNVDSGEVAGCGVYF